MNGAYYNEFDPHAAAWLRELIKSGHIADGDVDERSIIEVTADDVKGYRQQHFFAGIGGWSLAARLAGWPDDKPLFTGSPPCQPFSTAGKQLGKEDARHLAPHWLELVRTVRPPVVAGEQVAAAVNKDAWLDDLLDALEAESYATGAIVLPASFVGAPHIRQRIFFVGRLGDGEHERLEGLAGDGNDRHQPGRLDAQPHRPATEAGAVGGMADADGGQRQGLADGEGCEQHREATGRQQGNGEFAASSELCGLDNSSSPRHDRTEQGAEGKARDEARLRMPSAGCGQDRHGPTRPLATGWDAVDWLLCRDGKWRPVEPGTFPLAHGATARVGRLRGYGNAINAETARTFIAAYQEIQEDSV